MRKAHMQIVIDGLQKRIKDVEQQRDEARSAVLEGLTRLHEKAEAHAGALAKLSGDVSGLGDAVRAAMKPPPAAPAPEAPEAAEPVAPETPAAKPAARRNGKTPTAAS